MSRDVGCAMGVLCCWTSSAANARQFIIFKVIDVCMVSASGPAGSYCCVLVYPAMPADSAPAPAGVCPARPVDRAPQRA